MDLRTVIILLWVPSAFGFVAYSVPHGHRTASLRAHLVLSDDAAAKAKWLASRAQVSWKGTASATPGGERAGLSSRMKDAMKAAWYAKYGPEEEDETEPAAKTPAAEAPAPENEAESDAKPRKTRKRDRIKKAAKKVAAAASSVVRVKRGAFGAAPAGFTWGKIF